MAILVLFSFVYNINKFFEVRTGYVTNENNVTEATVEVPFYCSKVGLSCYDRDKNRTLAHAIRPITDKLQA